MGPPAVSGAPLKIHLEISLKVDFFGGLRRRPPPGMGAAREPREGGVFERLLSPFVPQTACFLIHFVPDSLRAAWGGSAGGSAVYIYVTSELF